MCRPLRSTGSENVERIGVPLELALHPLRPRLPAHISLTNRLRHDTGAAPLDDRSNNWSLKRGKKPLTDSSPTVRRIDYGTAAYRATCRLREDVLRVPLWQNLTEADTAGEDQQMHVAAFTSDDMTQPPIGCCVLKPVDAGTIKLRQMAVAESARGCGVGAAIVRFAESLAAAEGYRTIVMDAREAAAGFYESLGYTTERSGYDIIGLPHRWMSKSLSHRDR